MLQLPNNRGTVLVLALLMVAITQIILLSLVEKNAIELRIARNRVSSIENQHLLQGGVAWAITQVQQNISQGFNQFQTVIPPTDINNKQISVILTDAQSRININEFVNDNLDGIAKVMPLILPNMNEQNIVTMVQDMIALGNPTLQEDGDTDSIRYGIFGSSALSELAGLEGSEQILNILQYQSLSELLALDIITRDQISKMSPYFYALPAKVPVNINSANHYSLMFYLPTLTYEQASYIIELRNVTGGFISPEVLTSDPVGATFNLDAERMTVISQFYIARVDVTDQNETLTLYALLQGKQQEGEVQVSVLWHSYGTL